MGNELIFSMHGLLLVMQYDLKGPAKRSQLRSNRFRGCFRCNNGNDFKINQILPMFGPLLQEFWVIALHQLKASAEVGLNPAINVLQSIRHHPALLPISSIHRHCITILKVLDHHEKHFASFERSDNEQPVTNTSRRS